jgi:two-component system, OmpR family, sensor kinase
MSSATSPAKPRWYRSLYWRIGLGFVLTLAAMMAVQALVVVWMLGAGYEAPGPPPRAFARIVARDVSEALGGNPALDLERYVREEYQRRLYPFFLMMQDGRAIVSDGSTPDLALVEEARAFLDRVAGGPARPERAERPPRLRSRRPGSPDDPLRGFGVGSGVGLGGEGGLGPGIGPGVGRLLRGLGPPSEIVVQGRVVGVVFATPRSVVRRLGPTLAAVGAGLLLFGTVLASLLIFTPARSRLADLEATAAKVGRGTLTARAREDGGDEVASLAKAFNRMASDLDARATEAVAADRARRQLLADVSHELMTPLTSMRGYLETLGMPAVAGDAETRARYLAIVSDESHRLEQIVGDLLELARLEGGGGTLDVQDVALEGLFGRTCDRHEREAAAKGVSLTTHVGPGAEIVQGDGRRLEQAVQNLVANALRHTLRGGEIHVGCEIDGSDLVLSVRDSGHGIPPEHLPHVFDRFYKAESSRGGSAGGPTGASVAGSGLGLSIVKAIIERHGGTVSVASALGAGTTFTLRLPGGGGA